MFLQEAFSSVLLYIGAASAALFCFKVIRHISFYLLPNTTLSRWYHRQETPWALVTGSSAGIGLGAAQELASNGFNVVLLGHLPDELAQARSVIQAEYPESQVKLVVLDATLASPAEIEKALEPLAILPLTILVNNVGGFPMKLPAIQNLMNYTATELEHSLNINARFMAHVTRLLLPQLARSGPSLIISLSSAARMGIPGIVSYSGCKGFIISFSKALSREMDAAGLPVDVLAIIPGDVASQSNAIGLKPGTPTAREYAKVMMDRAGRAVARGEVECMPFWPHALQIKFIESLPSWMSQWLLLKTFKDKKKAFELDRKEKSS
ncbi:hypothetical protein BJ166DRAFT_492116 [Pestalotiopsis sp. NC0098]|nr:hypothetical protein BJ166DRAFT_492116 [Pestalotiopsis sp. NC0098]